MNTRIRELSRNVIIAQRAERPELPPLDDFTLNKILELREDYDKKLAELIVKECLTFIEPTTGSGDIDDLAFEGATNEIKEHFGITS